MSACEDELVPVADQLRVVLRRAQHTMSDEDVRRIERAVDRLDREGSPAGRALTARKDLYLLTDAIDDDHDAQQEFALAYAHCKRGLLALSEDDGRYAGGVADE
jgi:hypothetical protein